VETKIAIRVLVAPLEEEAVAPMNRFQHLGPVAIPTGELEGLETGMGMDDRFSTYLLESDTCIFCTVAVAPGVALAAQGLEPLVG
jgi:hypothetical protein